jgi:cobalt-zinc-cadmium efflux system protein
LSAVHGHHADHRSIGPASKRSGKPLAIVLGLTSLYLVAEVVGGLLTGSLALLADAGHMLADVLGLAMALFAIWFSQRPATPARTYGFYRAEILAAVANSLLLFGLAGYILLEAWQRFWAPAEIQSLPMLLVALGGLVVNLISLRLLHASAGESLNLRGAYLEVMADLLGSIGVVVAAAIIYLTGWWPADPLISVLIALLILPRTWSLLRGALDVLLESAPAGLDPTEIERATRSLPGVRAVHDLHVWSIASGFVALSAHVQIESRGSHDVLHELQAMLRERFNIHHTTLQVEAVDHPDEGACCTIDPRCLVVGARLPIENQPG